MTADKRFAPIDAVQQHAARLVGAERQANGTFAPIRNEYEPNAWRKRPVTITAQRMAAPFSVETLEGTMAGKAGDWLITGVNGEQYPCADDIFRKTYEAP